MADPVFRFRRQLAKSLVEPDRLKYRIVSEAEISARRLDNCPFNKAFHCVAKFPVTRNREHATKTRNERPLIGQPREIG